MRFLRWLGLHWTWTLAGVLLGPPLWPFDQEAAGFIAATAVFATATGAGHPLCARTVRLRSEYVLHRRRRKGYPSIVTAVMVAFEQEVM